MIANVGDSVSVRKPQEKEAIVDFSAEQVKAPFLLRCGALLADYVLLISIPVISLLVSRYMGNDGARLLNSELNNAGWLIAVFIGLTNFILMPMFTGQTMGKMLTGLRIVGIDGRSGSMAKIALRQTLGYFLTAATFGLGFFISVFGRKGRALHDYLSGTVVIYANKRPL
ncbi:MAG: RDD family protein [Saprospiraceae bacterium]|nr:RDD family protein [Pyrinomonadaceae bacterium]